MQPTKVEIPTDQTCQEASQHSSSFYIPCGKTATSIVRSRGEKPLYMCESCAWHNIHNRGAELLGRQLTQALEGDYKRGQDNAIIQ